MLEKYGKKGGANASSNKSSFSLPSSSNVVAATNFDKSMARANVVGTPVSSSTLPSNETLAALSELQPEHVRILLNMVNNKQDKMTGEHSFLSWIVDTEASQRVTSDASCLMDVHCILPCPVGLPDGAHAMLVKEGRL